MKKAKEYASQILEAKTYDEIKVKLTEVAEEMLKEIAELCKERHVKSDYGIKSIISQQDQKWKAICKILNNERQDNILNRDGFIDGLKAAAPMTEQILNS